MGAALVLGGYDINGPHLFTVRLPHVGLVGLPWWPGGTPRHRQPAARGVLLGIGLRKNRAAVGVGLQFMQRRALWRCIQQQAG
mgnify:CR=1 FL=1